MQRISKFIQKVQFSTAKLPKIHGGLKALEKADPEMYELVVDEQYRQWSELELIASENFTSGAVLDCLGSCLTNKYSEGQIAARYYGGNKYIDQIEQLCKDRALEAFRLDGEEWAVNVQAYSGSPANLGALCGALDNNDRIMGLSLPGGGHLTHGAFRSRGKKGKEAVEPNFYSLSVTSRFFNSFPYGVTPEGYIDYDELETNAKKFLPRLIIAGASAYPRDWDYERLKAIADDVGALLMVDMAHFSGLVAAEEHNNPFAYADIVTSTTHKTLGGPRGALIFSRKDTGLPAKIDFAVFPGLQGGPHNNVIAAIATQLKEVASPEFKQYAKQVKANAKALSGYLTEQGHSLMTGGTDNHLMLWNLRPLKITGSKAEKFFEFINITLNKNSIATDTSAATPYGVRIGTPALTSRGLVEEDFVQVGKFLDEGIKLACKIQQRVRDENDGKCNLKSFVQACEEDEEIPVLAKAIEEYSQGFYFPGLGEEYMD